MKTILFLAVNALVFFVANAQNPVVVTSVNGLVTEPKNKDQNEWINNSWGGKRFYQGTGTPTKLCVTDGTAAGTVHIKDIGNGGIQNTIPARDFIYVITSELVFTPSFSIIHQIWKSDGTANGTELVKTMAPFPFSAAGNAFHSDANMDFNFSVDENLMYFQGYDATNGSELWRTDGTAAGTYLVKDIKPGTGNSLTGGFCKIGSKTLFRAAAVGLGTTLWETDGTAAGTQEIPVAGMTFFDPPVGKINGKMIFFGNDAVNGVEPWVTDGTAAGTFMLKDINPGTGRSLPATAQNLHLQFNNKYVFFMAEVAGVKTLWRTDGTTAGTINLSPAALGNNFGGGGYSAIDDNGLWWIEGNTGLYFSDGTVTGTRKVTGSLYNALYMALYKRAAWFHARNSDNLTNGEPYRSDGIGANTGRLEVQAGQASSYPYGFFVQNNMLYFFGNSNPGIKLYQYNGDMTFNGSVVGGRWRDSANWNSMMPPGITDTAYINTGFTVNVDGSNAYAGTLIMQNGSNVNLSAPTDTLFIHQSLQGTTATGNGVVALKNFNGDTMRLNSAFEGNKINADGYVAINNNLRINDNLQLTNNARLFANNSDVILSGIISTVTNTVNSYIVTNGTGSLTIENIGSGGRTGNLVYPIGTAANYNPVSFSNSGTADVFSARVEPGISNNYVGETPSGSSYTGGAVNATWYIKEGTVGGSNATIGLQWNAVQELPSFDRNQSRLGHYVGGAWQLGTAGIASGTNPYSWSGSGFSSFSPFGVLNSNATLPLSHVSLNVKKSGTNNQCAWTVATTDGQSIYIERSENGREFAAIYSGAFLSTGLYVDVTAPAKNNYYRLKVIGKNGAIKYSNIVWIGNDSKAVVVYPTLLQQSFVVQNNQRGRAVLTVYSADGKTVLVQQLQEGTNYVTAEKFSKGTYFYQVIIDAKSVTTGQLIKQ